MHKVTENPDTVYKKINTARSLATKILHKIERSGAYPDKLLAFELNNPDLKPEDKALLVELVMGVTRWKARLDWVLVGFFHGDYQKCFNYIKNALRIGLYQILFLDRVPNSAAIDESVEIVKRKQGYKTGGLVNGVLRNIARNIENIRYPKEYDDWAFHISVMQSFPKWMVVRWIDRFGKEETVSLMEKFNEKPITHFRVNTLKLSVDEIIQIFKDNNVEFTQSPYMEGSFYLNDTAIRIANSDLFNNGKVAIQDTSASLVSILANPSPGMRILDACAAPGGKTCHLAELMHNKGKIIALDKFSGRLKSIVDNYERLGLDIIHEKGTKIEDYRNKKLFDMVLLDVPCTGHGTFSKRPDIKWNSDDNSMHDLMKIQKRILDNAVKFLKKDGVLVYSTCSIEPEENELNIKWFLERYPEFELDRAENYLHQDICKDGFMMTLPHKHDMDGAFAARLIKKRESEKVKK